MYFPSDFGLVFKCCDIETLTSAFELLARGGRLTVGYVALLRAENLEGPDLPSDDSEDHEEEEFVPPLLVFYDPFSKPLVPKGTNLVKVTKPKPAALAHMVYANLEQFPDDVYGPSPHEGSQLGWILTAGRSLDYMHDLFEKYPDIDVRPFVCAIQPTWVFWAK